MVHSSYCIGGFITRGASPTVGQPRRYNEPIYTTEFKFRSSMVGCTAPRGYNESTYTTVHRYIKSAVTDEKCPLVAELKLKIRKSFFFNFSSATRGCF